MAIKESITLEEVIAFLNSLLEIDREAVTTLFDAARVPCSEGLANHPTVQVVPNRAPEVYGKYSVGVLGILNGMFGTDNESWGTIYMDMDEGKIVRFKDGGRR
jgi:hypothetical protein